MRFNTFIIFMCFVSQAVASDCFAPQPVVYAKFCSEKGRRSVVGDFDGNGHDDMLCHDPNTGHVQIHYSHRNSFQPLTWSRDIDWCLESNSELFVGDFNGDKKSDLLCHHNNGFKDYAFANAEGVFSGRSFSKNMGWCKHNGAQILIGDFNGDGRSDLLCHDKNTGYKWIAYSNNKGEIHSTSWRKSFDKCDGEMLIGDFNGDKKSDLLCYNYNTGRFGITLTSNGFSKVDYHNRNNVQKWCDQPGAFIRIADINKDGLDDFICKDSHPNGKVKIIKNQAPLYFDTRSTTYTTYFCSNSNRKNFYIGQFSSGKEADLLCLDNTGTIRVEESQCI